MKRIGKDMLEINKLYNENCIETMHKMDDQFLSGVICSPPYNICSKRKDGYYNNGYMDIDNLTEDQYLEVRLNEFKEFERILKDDGVILYNISYHIENPILPTLLMGEIHKNTGLTIADIITWKKKVSMPFQSSSNKLSRQCELVYVIVKKTHLQDRKGKTFKANKEVSKINEKTGQKFYKHYVNLVEAANNDGYKCKLKASYSTELVTKLINIYFPKDSLIYDPFSGIGTTQLGCQNSGCSWVGSELDKEHFEIAEKRLSLNQK